MLFELQTCM